jgi:hypothetical protein
LAAAKASALARETAKAKAKLREMGILTTVVTVMEIVGITNPPSRAAANPVLVC